MAGKLNGLGIDTQIQVIRTTGDHMQTAAMVQSRGKGLFTKEIEEALLAREIDLAVHSLKDLPTEDTAGLTVAAIPVREDPRDALVGVPFDQLAETARVGTSSSRRVSQLKLMRPLLRTQPIRGNVDTRLRKLAEGQFDALVLAAAGLRRLGLAHHISHVFAVDEICPAPGQGALALQTRVDDKAAEMCRALNHRETELAVRCERAVLAGLGGGCELPIGAFALVADHEMQITAIALSPAGSHSVRAACRGHADDAIAIGKRAAEELIAQGAHDLLHA